MAHPPLPWRIEPAPDPIDPDLEPLLDEPMATAYAAQTDTPAGLRGRLLQRLSASQQAEAGKLTARHARLAAVELAAGVTEKRLYTGAADRVPRPGEPQRVRLIDLQPGCRWQGPEATSHREWLVLHGEVDIGATRLGPRDYHVMPAGSPVVAVQATSGGARLFLRESAQAATPGEAASTVLDAEAGWPDFGPGVRRRVLWQRDGQAALLYLTQAGAQVPLHTHGHDEECLMVQGELFLDDLLLREGDYQLAPAGTEHRSTETDTGAVIYAHGDLDLRFMS